LPFFYRNGAIQRTSGREIDEGAVIAAKVNRLAGHYARPTPATQVTEIIHHIPRALADLL